MPDAEEAATSEARPGGCRRWFVAGALIVWLWSTFAHGYGTDVARRIFTWAQIAGNLHPDGGGAGMHAVESIMQVVFVSTLAGIVGVIAWRLRELDGAQWRARLFPWALWGCFICLIWKTVIVYSTELVHFAQYGLISALLCAAIDRGARPRLAFLIATGLGVLDEAWQHYGLAVWIEGNLSHGLDWSDLILNAAGSCGGVLIFVAGARGARSTETSDRWFLGVIAALGAALLPLLLLDRATLASLFGSYTYHPFWNELENGKPVHWMTPIDGIPLFVASVLFLGLVIGGRRAFATRSVALALLLLVTLSIQPPSRLGGRPVHEVVPTTTARRVAPGSVVVDGVLNETAWIDAPRIGPFVHSISGEGWVLLGGGDRVPLAPTYARIVWDDRALYIAFEAEDADVWGRPLGRDDPTLPGDEVVEVFLDPDGDEVTYYEFEFSPLNVQYDLFNLIPEPPADFNPTATFIGLADWDARDMVSAVDVRGTLDHVAEWSPAVPGPRDTDQGWTIEIAIPWSAFRTTTTPHATSRVSLPPVPGDQWRLGLFRVERPRVSPVDGTPLTRGDASRFAQFQGWSPTHRPSFHRPSRFGILEFLAE